MAKPKSEHGYTNPNFNQLVEVLARTRLAPREWQVLQVIIRKTVGWEKTKDQISHSQFARMTGIARRHINTILKQLEKKKIVTRTGNSKTHEFRINLAFEQWQTVTKTGNCSQIQEGVFPAEGAKLAPELGTTKEKELYKGRGFFKNSGGGDNSPSSSSESPIERALRKGWY